MLRGKQEKVRKERREFAARRISLAGSADEGLKSWALAKPPPAVPLSLPSSPTGLAPRLEDDLQPRYQKLCHFMETGHEATHKLLEVLDLSPDSVFYDLGSGDGRVVVAVTKRFGCKGVGIEVSSSLVQQAKSRAQAELADSPQLLDQVLFLHEDVGRVSLDDATAVFIYMPMEGMTAMLCQVLPRTKIRDGTLVYTNENCPASGGNPHCKHRASYWQSQGGIHCFEWRRQPTAGARNHNGR